MGLIEDLRSELETTVAAEMAAVVDERLGAVIAQKRDSLVSQKDQLTAELARVETEIAELAPVEVSEPVAEEVVEVTEEPQG
jgi:ABC-type Zn2+ transport system substrate-binding protein/surface adhesin